MEETPTLETLPRRPQMITVLVIGVDPIEVGQNPIVRIRIQDLRSTPTYEAFAPINASFSATTTYQQGTKYRTGSVWMRLEDYGRSSRDIENRKVKVNALHVKWDDD